MTERKYALTKIAAGDYLLPSNNGQTIWRIAVYTDGPSQGLDWAKDRDVWGVWRWRKPASATYVDTTNWDDWDMISSSHDTRADAIREALRVP